MVRKRRANGADVALPGPSVPESRDGFRLLNRRDGPLRIMSVDQNADDEHSTAQTADARQVAHRRQDVPTILSKEEKDPERVRSSLEKLPARSRVSDACFAHAELAQSADRSSSTSRRKVSSVSSTCGVGRGGRDAQVACEMRRQDAGP
jgi:hypothetical protein